MKTIGIIGGWAGTFRKNHPVVGTDRPDCRLDESTASRLTGWYSKSSQE